MSELRCLGPDDWELFRGIRLRSLADSPDAFGSTFEREQAFTEADWRRRAVGPLYVVLDPAPVSMGGIFDHDGVGQVWGMWTDPAHRGRGHARRVLDAVTPHHDRVELHVNTANPAARSVYERYGFVGTNQIEPLRPGSDQRMERMVLPPRGRD
jgi:RimJ/RimL family protein N-acetyltransferase